MVQPSYRPHRFPAEIIQHAIWLYLRFTLSCRDVEELLAEAFSRQLLVPTGLPTLVQKSQPGDPSVEIRAE